MVDYEESSFFIREFKDENVLKDRTFLSERKQ